MSSVSWIQLPNNFFKSHYIDELMCDRQGKDAVLLYLQLVCLASEVKNGGLLISHNTPITVEKIAMLVNKRRNYVTLLLEILLARGLLEYLNGILFIPDWPTYESENRLEKIRAYDRARKQKERAKRAEIAALVQRTKQEISI